MSARTVSVRLLAEISGYVSPMKAAIQSTKDLKTELSKAASEGKLDAVASSASKMGLALSGGFLVAVTAAARFEKAMSEVDAVAGASASQMQALSDAALQAGKDTQYSATEAAKAEAELAKAGLSASDILGGALTGSLSLAAAGGLDLAEAADVAAKAMNVFNLTGKDVGHVADVLAAAANKSATDVHELSFALKMGGLAAKNSGVSLEETVGTLAAFADNALVGSDAGTSFKQMLMMLQSPSEKAAAMMTDLGISAYDAAGNFVGIAGLADNLREKLAGLTMEKRNEALSTIFGSDAMRAATVLYDEGAQGIRDYTAAVNDQGAAAETARKKTDNLMGDIERLTGSLETLFIQAGTGSASGLRFLVQDLGKIIDMVTSLPAPVLTFGTILLGLSGAGMLAFSAFIKIRGAVADMAEEMRNAGPIMGRVGAGLELTTKWAGRAALALTALHVASLVATAVFGSELNPQIKALNKDLAKFGETGKASGEMARLFGGDMKKLDTALANATSSGKGFALWMESVIPGAADADRSWTKNIERINAMDTALAEMAAGGHADEAAASFKRLWVEAQAQGKTLEQFQGAFPAYVAAAAAAAAANDEQAIAAAAAKESNIKLAGAFGAAASEAEGLKNAFDRLNGAELSWREAERNAEQAVDDLTTKLKESNGSLDVHNEKGRAASAAVDELAKSAAVAAQKKYEETGSVEAANATYQTYIGQLRGALKAAGVLPAEIDRITASIAQMPSTKNIDINVTTWYREHVIGNQASNNQKRLDKIANRRGGAYVHAEEGVLRQAGVYTTQAPARYAFAEPATKGEAFIPKSGDYGRSMGILQTAAGWYGAEVIPRQQQGWYGGGGGMGSTPSYGGSGGGGGGPLQLELVVTPAPGADAKVMGAITEGLRFDIRTKSDGSVQTHLEPRGRG